MKVIPVVPISPVHPSIFILALELDELNVIPVLFVKFK